MLSSCNGGGEDNTIDLIDAIEPGNPKRESNWGNLAAHVPNNISNTFTGDPGTTRTITWQSSRSPGEVIMGNNRYPSTSVFHDNYYFHRVDINGLNPGKTYRFMAGTANGGYYSPIYSFKTASNNPTSFSILHITDPQIRASSDDKIPDSKSWKRVIEAAVIKCPDAAFVVNTGDIVNNKREDRLPYYFDYAQEILAKYAFIYSLGNNDLLEWYDRYFYITDNRKKDSSGLLYSFDYGNTHFISINYDFRGDDNDDIDSGFELSTVQLSWLRGDLNKTTKKWKVVLIHMPDYGKKTSINANTDLSKILDTYNVNLVLAGHYHFYARSKPISTAGYLKAGGTMWAILNAAGTKFNNVDSLDPRDYLAAREQPDLPMFIELVFTDTNIRLNAFTVNNDGTAELIDAYTYYDNGIY